MRKRGGITSVLLLVKKGKGLRVIEWKRATARVRVPLSPISYIDRETFVSGEIDKLTGENYGHHKKDK